MVLVYIRTSVKTIKMNPYPGGGNSQSEHTDNILQKATILKPVMPPPPYEHDTSCTAWWEWWQVTQSDQTREVDLHHTTRPSSIIWEFLPLKVATLHEIAEILNFILRWFKPRITPSNREKILPGLSGVPKRWTLPLSKYFEYSS